MSRDWSLAREKVAAEGQCRVCGSRDSLEAAHVVPRSLGGRQSAESTVPLCRTCHRSYDAGQLDLLPALTFQEQAEAVSVLGIVRALQRLSPAENPKRVRRAA